MDKSVKDKLMSFAAGKGGGGGQTVVKESSSSSPPSSTTEDDNSSGMLFDIASKLGDILDLSDEKISAIADCLQELMEYDKKMDQTQ